MWLIVALYINHLETQIQSLEKQLHGKQRIIGMALNKIPLHSTHVEKGGGILIQSIE